MSWLTTVDHKRIGFLYGISALFFFLVGGVEALLIRIQLAVPNNTFLTSAQYNEMFTMHATTMIFLVVMPLGAAFFNFIMPLQIGARDVAFPRLNAFSFWTFLAGAIILNLGWFMKDGAPDAGWFGYTPLTTRHRSARPRDRHVGDGPAAPRRRLDRGGAQLHRHDHQPARARHDDDAPAGLHLDDAGHRRS
jgi:heme/copper-type cytochrome/quinol oxidase subunit 1